MSHSALHDSVNWFSIIDTNNSCAWKLLIS